MKHNFRIDSTMINSENQAVVYRIKTYHAGIIVKRNKDGILFGADENYNRNEFSEVVAIKCQRVLFLFSFNEMYQPINICRMDFSSYILPLYCFELGEEKYALSDINYSKSYISALAHSSDRGNGHLEAKRKNILNWEEFSLIPLNITEKYKSDIVNYVQYLSCNELCVSSIMHVAYNYSGVYLDFILSSQLFRSSIQFIDEMKDFLCNIDDYIYDSINKKTSFYFSKFIFNNSRKYINNKIDGNVFHKSEYGEYFFSNYYNGSNIYDFFQYMNYSLRKSVRPNKKMCVLATIRNEGIYIIEWISYHLSIGVEHFFIYSNGNNDGSQGILEELASMGIITYIENKVSEGVIAQRKAYGHALTYLPQILEYEWCAIIDGDEFLTINNDKYDNFLDFINFMACKETDAIALNWKMIGSNDVTTVEDVFQPLSYRNKRVVGAGAIGHGFRLVKSIIRPNRFLHSKGHHPIINDVMHASYRVSNRQLHLYQSPPPGFHRDPAFSDTFCDENAYVSHFYFKSSLEWFWKGCRNRGQQSVSDVSFSNINDQWGNAFSLQKDDKHKETNIIDNERNEKFLEILSKLRENEKISACESDIKYLFCKKIKEYFDKFTEDSKNNETIKKWNFIIDDVHKILSKK